MGPCGPASAQRTWPGSSRALALGWAMGGAPRPRQPGPGPVGATRTALDVLCQSPGTGIITLEPDLAVPWLLASESPS